MEKYMLLLIVLFMNSCNAQSNREVTKSSQTSEKMITKTFDLKLFNKNKIDREYNFSLNDGTKIKQFENLDTFTEIIVPPKPNLYHVQNEYFKNGSLYLNFVFFENDFTKLKKEYNESGKLVSEIEYDLPFTFTFEQLLELLREKDYGVDIYDENTSISRGIVEGKAIWQVEWKKIFGRRETLIVDGVAGNILEQGSYLMLDN